jgi:hypothetical protein
MTEETLKHFNVDGLFDLMGSTGNYQNYQFICGSSALLAVITF